MLRGVAVGAAAALIDAYVSHEEEAQLREVFRRFGLDPANPADVAAAVAYRWAQFKGAWRLGGPTSGPGMEAMAEGVMRAVQADPALLGGLLSDDAGALGTMRSTLQATASNGEIVTSNDEERQLVAKLQKEGKSRREILDALDAFRKGRGELGRLDLPENPDDLLKRGWIETTDPRAPANDHRKFVHPETGERISFDKGDPSGSRYQRHDHYHRENPAATSKRDQYLDVHGNPVAKGSKPSHILPGEY